MNLTYWFPGSAKPVRKGVYQRMYTYGKATQAQSCYWSGKSWCMGEPRADLAQAYEMSATNGLAPNQSLPWRGVLK
jgi:hypothetical protein